MNEPTAKRVAIHWRKIPSLVVAPESFRALNYFHMGMVSVALYVALFGIGAWALPSLLVWSAFVWMVVTIPSKGIRTAGDLVAVDGMMRRAVFAARDVHWVAVYNAKGAISFGLLDSRAIAWFVRPRFGLRDTAATSASNARALASVFGEKRVYFDTDPVVRDSLALPYKSLPIHHEVITPGPIGLGIFIAYLALNLTTLAILIWG